MKKLRQRSHFASIALAVFLSFSPLISCMVPSRSVPKYEDVRQTDLSADSLGLRRGVSKLDDVKESLRKRASNVVSAQGLDAKGGNAMIEALSADGMAQLLIFKNNKFEKALPVGCEKGTNTKMYLHVAKTEGTNAVIVVSQEIRSRGIPSVIVVLDRDPPKRYAIAYDFFPEWFKGVVDPLMVGGDLDKDGVTFVARGENHLPWDNALILKCDGKKVEVRQVSMQEAAQGCECIGEWFSK